MYILEGSDICTVDQKRLEVTSVNITGLKKHQLDLI